VQTKASGVRLIGTFLLLLCVFSAFAYFLIIHIHRETAMLSRFIMWCPGAAALATCAIWSAPQASLGWRWPKARWLVLSYLLPIIYALPVYILTWMSVRGAFSPAAFLSSSAGQYGFSSTPVLATALVGVPLLGILGVLSTCTWALGEELGWRGLFMPQLNNQFGFAAACLTSGLVWAVWHFPGLLWADYNAGTNPLFAMVCFTIMVVGMAFIMGWLRLRSGSIWPCAMLHASHNTFIQGVFDPLTSQVGLSREITTEFGFGLATTVCISAAVLLMLPRVSLSMGGGIGYTASLPNGQRNVRSAAKRSGEARV
jgi:uncharacterized protein